MGTVFVLHRRTDKGAAAGFVPPLFFRFAARLPLPPRPWCALPVGAPTGPLYGSREGLLATAAFAVILAAAFIFASSIEPPVSILAGDMWNLLYRGGLGRRITGFALLGCFPAAAALSLRRRWPRIRFGNFDRRRMARSARRGWSSRLPTPACGRGPVSIWRCRRSRCRGRGGRQALLRDGRVGRRRVFHRRLCRHARRACLRLAPQRAQRQPARRLRVGRNHGRRRHPHSAGLTERSNLNARPRDAPTDGYSCAGCR